MNSCQPLWKGSKTPTKWGLWYGVGEYDQGVHTGDFGFLSVFSDSQCHHYESMLGGGYSPLTHPPAIGWSMTGPTANPPANTVVLMQYSQPNRGGQLVSWAFFPTDTGDCQNSGPFPDVHYDSCSASTGTYNMSVFASDNSTCVGGMTSQVLEQAQFDQYISNSYEDLGWFMGYVSYSCGQLSPYNSTTATAPNSTLVPQSGYLTYTEGFNGLGGEATGGVVLNSCQPLSGEVVAGVPTKYAMFSVLAEVVSGTVVGYHVFSSEFTDSSCHAFIGIAFSFYSAVGQRPYFGISAVVPAPPTNTVDITQFSQPNMGGQVVTWAYFTTGAGTCQNSGPNSDMHYDSCSQSGGNYTVTIFDSDNNTCVGGSSVITATESYINAQVSVHLLDLGYFAGYDFYTCGQLPSVFTR